MISKSEFEAFARLDLDAIKVKLMHESGEGWSPARAANVETEYRRFLFLAKAFPEEPKSPMDDVDTFWHYHILDTMKYAADCEQLFGHFLHHFPYAGMRGEADWQALQHIGMRTAMLYEGTFGARYPGASVHATAQAALGHATDSVETAYCYDTVQRYPAGAVQTAYCYDTVQTSPAGAVQTAYCYDTVQRSPTAAVQTAYCTYVPRAGAVQTAYCYVPDKAPRARAVLPSLAS